MTRVSVWIKKNALDDQAEKAWEEAEMKGKGYVVSDEGKIGSDPERLELTVKGDGRDVFMTLTLDAAELYDFLVNHMRAMMEIYVQRQQDVVKILDAMPKKSTKKQLEEKLEE